MTDTIDIATPAFAHRLGNLLTATRHRNHRTLRSLSRQSAGRFSRADLLALEQGGHLVDADTLDAVAGLYGCDLSSITPARLPIEISGSVVRSGGVEESFVGDSDASLLDAYLRLVRTLRGQRRSPVLVLRTDDIEVLAEHLHADRETVAGWLLARMNAAPMKRTALAGMLATGVVVVGLVGTAAAGGDDDPVGHLPASPGAAAVVVVDVPAEPGDDGWSVVPEPAVVEAIVAVGEPPVPSSDASGTSVEVVVPIVGFDDPSLAPVVPEMSVGDEAPPLPDWVEGASDDAPPVLEPEMSLGDEPPPLPEP